MLLESLHVYSIVAFVIKKNGILTKGQNVLIGWGIPLGIILVKNIFHKNLTVYHPFQAILIFIYRLS